MNSHTFPYKLTVGWCCGTGSIESVVLSNLVLTCIPGDSYRAAYLGK